jgi:hypothetical protein
MWATSVIFKMLAKINSYPMGNKSPNLVTLIVNALQHRLVNCVSSKLGLCLRKRRHTFDIGIERDLEFPFLL